MNVYLGSCLKVNSEMGKNIIIFNGEHTSFLNYDIENKSESIYDRFIISQ